MAAPWYTMHAVPLEGATATLPAASWTAVAPCQVPRVDPVGAGRPVPEAPNAGKMNHKSEVRLARAEDCLEQDRAFCVVAVKCALKREDYEAATQADVTMVSACHKFDYVWPLN